MSRKGKSAETEGTLLVTGGWGREGHGVTAVGAGVHLGDGNGLERGMDGDGKTSEVRQMSPNRVL